MIGTCDACVRQNVPVSHGHSSIGETTQCFICRGDDNPDPYGEMPEMKEGGQCPYCGGPTVNVAFEYITCGASWNQDCPGHRVRAPTKPQFFGAQCSAYPNCHGGCGCGCTREVA